ncbi:uncharacterized protein RMCC_4072 [Mycolicibacterium canariasense]|uniref:Uncharacterized protein n=1 Tax=Mycolicibacterium canariasense TaxID=228230 RepID=A0A100WF89_MYCCR|nr:hypothetical protein [Mycolicibacterium canariasense]MCV7213468.1 hypothetical protein [Mycolicibacterium canariasense]ORV09010.1 hypothetical protein AWB94_10470 [Mycolicibacterium canariasense]GAS97106.1 uncharacterized protein RMCC_4072 [Mycolicibacterium canariasense]
MVTTLPLDAEPADVAEQAMPVIDDDFDYGAATFPLPMEVDPADYWHQRDVVVLPDDEYPMYAELEDIA